MNERSSPGIEDTSDFWMAERGMKIRLEVQCPDGGWVAIFPAQLEQMIRQGAPVRATEVDYADAAARASEPVAWRYRFVTSVDGKEWSDWFIVDDPKSIPSREGQIVQPLYASVAQPMSDQLLNNLVDWTWIHATEGAHWPSAKTMADLIRKAKERRPTQEDAGRYISISSTEDKS